ncbi:MAG: carbohydrate binding family 9 domain-containing protein, partial [Vicinamibacteria bacterium]|nr:carbohydrate binding family 9 domain-containing protein [Vicinamibacteria bacterium]
IARDANGRVTMRATRIDVPLRIDGVLDDSPYRSVASISDFIQQEPDEGQPASERTEVWILADRDHLYIGVRCHDSQTSRIVANDMRRDGRNIGQNDNLSIVIDSFYDRRNGYEFLVNAVGGMADAQITDERDVNRDWNTVWQYRAKRDAGGWTAEMAFPFRSLRYRPGATQVWGLNIRRTIRWKNEFVYLSPVPRTQGVRGILKLSSAGTLVGLEAPSGVLSLDIKPYVLGAARADRAVDPSFETDLDGDAGVDVKYGITRGLTADFTYRTDFAQVEDDDQQVNLTRFSLFFPEKREFFLEGQGIFAFGGVETAPRAGTSLGPVNTPVLFFSRQIGLLGSTPVPIDVGGRLTGKAGRYSVGLLNIQTGDEPDIGAASTNFGVVRLKRDILRRSYIGVIGTRRSPATDVDGANSVFGIDTGLSFYDSLNMVGYYAQTDTPGLHGKDHSYRARLDYQADRLGLVLEHLGVGQNFKPEVGFLRRSDFIESLAQLRVSRRPPSLQSVRRINLEFGFDYITDGERRLENRLFQTALRTEMQSGDSWSVRYEQTYEFVPAPFTLPGGILVPVGAYINPFGVAIYTLGSQRKISGEISTGHGGFYDGTRTDLSYRGRIELMPQLSLEPGIGVNWIDLPQGETTAKLASVRSTYSFSPSMWVAALVQYNSTQTVLSTNVRFKWEYHPGSDLFVVYSDGRDTVDRFRPALQNRSLAVKVTRLLRVG